MANYSIIANSTFQPFTYQELMAPVQRMSDVHDLVAAQYDALSSQADILEAMGANDVDRDSKAYSQYKAYSDSLRNEADALNKYGLQLDSKGRMLELRSRYNKEIQPIKTAYEKRTAEAKEQQDAWMKNPSLMFTRTAAQTSIDDYVANPNGGYGVINGALITQQMSEMASQLAKQVREGKITRNDIDPYTYDLITKTGLDENDINMWLANPDSYPTLSNMMNQVLQSNGVTAEALQGSRNAQDIISKSINYAQMGAWSAIGEDKHNIQANYGARAALEDYYNAQSQARSHAYAMQQQAAKATVSGNGGNSNTILNPLAIRTSSSNAKNGTGDIYRGTEYDRQLNSSYGDTYMKQIMAAATGGDGKVIVHPVVFDENEGWKESKKALTAEDLKDYKVTNIRYSKYGNTAIIQKNGSDPIRIRLPRGINKTAEDNVSIAIANADDYGEILEKGKRPHVSNGNIMRDTKGRIMYTGFDLTEDDVLRFNKLRRDALTEMSSYGSQFVIPSDTKDEQFNPFPY